jgi:hypothetical protein
MTKLMVYFDNCYSDNSKLIEKMESEDDVTEVVILEGHNLYKKASNWASRKRIPVKKYDLRPGLYGNFCKHVMFRNAIQEAKPDKIITFGKRHYSLLSQAELNKIKIESIG